MRIMTLDIVVFFRIFDQEFDRLHFKRPLVIADQILDRFLTLLCLSLFLPLSGNTLKELFCKQAILKIIRLIFGIAAYYSTHL